MKTRFVLIFFCASFAGTLVSLTNSQAQSCSRREAIEAEAEASNLRDWHSVYESYKNFSHCDDGSIAEGYSDTIGRLLANNWDQLDILQKLTNRDNNFEKFIVRHIDETVPNVRLNKIIENAHRNCGHYTKRLCRLIEAAAS